TEEFVLERAVDVSLSLMTAVEPSIEAEGVKIGRARLVFPKAELNATAERIAITDETLKHSWGEAVYRIKLNSLSPVASGKWKLELQPIRS
ncbi:MAG TPA: hypothetical protein VJU82_04025, partial [Acidobacteriaceae bacterium]|nr:hypothetical protein [Acidobacteriaceae bacterium]